MKFPQLILSAALGFLAVQADAARLTDNGRPVCSVVLAKDAGPVEKHAAEEFAKFLAKISGGGKPRIAAAPEAGKYPVVLSLTDDKKVGEQGFLIDAKKDALRISGRTPLGVLYGVYELLKRYGGIRWLVPGEDGEYFTKKPTISVPEGKISENPDFAFRYISAICMRWSSPVWDTWDWCVRNNMRIEVPMRLIQRENLRDGLLARGAVSLNGGHCFTPLLTGWGLEKRTAKEQKAYTEKLFAEHPEYFPLIHGKRVISYDGGSTSPQPCTTNPDVIRIVAKNLVRWQKGVNPPGVYWFTNNDTPQWCHCEKCLAVDPSAEKAKGILSTRYWIFANAVLNQALKECPDLKLSASSYQNYSELPIGVKPDLRVANVMVSNHRRCWKHALDDKNCPTNRWYYEYNRSWNSMNVPLFTYEELCRAGSTFLPNEKPWVDTLKYYKKEMPNFIGMKTEVCCPDGSYGKIYNTPRRRENWYMMWQAMYLGMAFHWNVNADFDKLSEEINSLYYGKGWRGGMKEFRGLLTKLYMEAGGCWGYGHSIPVGKFLDVPGAEKKLLALLDSAEKAAAADPDKRALAHVKRDRRFFMDTWIKAHREYISNYREIKAYPLQGKIVVDGKLDEADWKNADIVTRFKRPDGKTAEYQTSVKLAYDADNLYFGIECLEPFPGKLCTNVKKHDGPVWEDNDVEIFINDPMLGSTYFQIMINAAGVICDGSVAPGQKGVTKTFESNAEVKTAFGKDRWFMEIRLPVKPLTGGRLNGGEVLKMNFMRVRRLDAMKLGSETSTWSTGTPHNVETFHAVTFAAPRSVSKGNRSEVDTRLWKNGSFNEAEINARRIPKHWRIKENRIPKFWNFSSGVQYGGEIEYPAHKDGGNDRYLRLRKGFVFQKYGIKSGSVGVSCRIRGKGKLEFGVLRYKNGKHLRTELLRTEEVDSTGWKNITFEFRRPGGKDETQCFLLWPRAGEVDIDDLFLAPR